MTDDLLDAAALDALLKTTGGDLDFFDELVETFLTDGADLLATLERALAAGDAAELRRAAHSLKSNAATFGATALADLARVLEERGKQGELVDAAPLADLASAEFGRAADALRARRAAP